MTVGKENVAHAFLLGDSNALPSSHTTRSHTADFLNSLPIRIMEVPSRWGNNPRFTIVFIFTGWFLVPPLDGFSSCMPIENFDLLVSLGALISYHTCCRWKHVWNKITVMPPYRMDNPSLWFACPCLGKFSKLMWLKKKKHRNRSPLSLTIAIAMEGVYNTPSIFPPPSVIFRCLLICWIAVYVWTMQVNTSINFRLSQMQAQKRLSSLAGSLIRYWNWAWHVMVSIAASGLQPSYDQILARIMGL